MALVSFLFVRTACEMDFPCIIIEGVILKRVLSVVIKILTFIEKRFITITIMNIYFILFCYLILNSFVNISL